MKVIMTESQRGERSLYTTLHFTVSNIILSGPTTIFFLKLVIMLAVSGSCLSSDDYVILSSTNKPFALSPLSFPPH